VRKRAQRRAEPAVRDDCRAAGQQRVVVTPGHDVERLGRAKARAVRGRAECERRVETGVRDRIAHTLDQGGLAVHDRGAEAQQHPVSASRRRRRGGPYPERAGVPTSPAEWGPPPDRPCHRVLWTGRRGDPHANRPDPGLLEIEVDEVLAALRD
jgi:hypothetical protein